MNTAVFRLKLPVASNTSIEFNNKIHDENSLNDENSKGEAAVNKFRMVHHGRSNQPLVKYDMILSEFWNNYYVEKKRTI